MDEEKIRATTGEISGIKQKGTDLKEVSKARQKQLPKDFLWIGKGNWESTIYLFSYEHPVPGFSPNVAAFFGTGFEVLCPILLIAGFGTRVAATILLIMTAFIQFTYQEHITHIYWMILLSVLLFQGPGKISIDNIIRNKTISNDRYKKLAGIVKDDF